jgi:hypothetical protein
MRASTTYKATQRLPSGTKVSVRIDVAEDDAYDDQGEFADVAQGFASAAANVVRRNLDVAQSGEHDLPGLSRDPWEDVVRPGGRPVGQTSTPATQVRGVNDEHIGPGEPPC